MHIETSDVRDIILRVIVAVNEGRGVKLNHDECKAVAQIPGLADLAGPVDLSVKPRVRAYKTKHDFWNVRAGHTIEVDTSIERTRTLSAFINWKKNRPGSLKAKSRKTLTGYVITFEGTSPAEVNMARITGSQQEEI